jgi:hypothetical protein
MVTRARHATNGTARPRARASPRLAAARQAADDLRLDAGTWLHLRRARLVGGVRRAAWGLLAWLLLSFTLFVIVGAAAVMLLTNAANSIAAMLGTTPAVGSMIVAVAAFVSLGALLMLGRRDTIGADADIAEARLRISMRSSLRRLGGCVWSLPGLLLVGLTGFVSVRALRDRRLRRLLLVGVSTLRTTRRLLATDPPSVSGASRTSAGRAAG